MILIAFIAEPWQIHLGGATVIAILFAINAVDRWVAKREWEQEQRHRGLVS